METTTKTEVLIAVPKADDEWEWGGNVSSLFRYALTDRWAERMYAPYYKDFWADLHEKMFQRNYPTEVTIEVEYTIGSASENEMRDLMEQWKSLNPKEGNFLTVDRQEDGNLSFVRMQTLAFLYRQVKPV